MVALPTYMARIREHLLAERGMDEAKATSTAIATAVLFCRSGRSPNLPVTVNAASRAEACRAVAELQAAKAKRLPSARPVEVSEEPWDGSPGRFTDEQWREACVLDRGGDAPPKERYSLPVREPDGRLSRAGVRAATAQLSRVKAPAAAIAAAARRLLGLFRQLGEEPPADVARLAGVSAAAGAEAAKRRQEGRGMDEELEVVEERSAPELSVEGRRLRGRIPYGVESRDLGGFTEVMRPGCLAGADLSDLVATVDHAGLPVGRYPGTIEIEDRDDGLHWSVELPESRSDVREAVERGDLRASSWRMVVARDSWDGNRRTVEEVRSLRDVAVVTTSAYPQAAAFAELRSATEAEPAERREEETRTMDEEIEDRGGEEPGGGGLLVEDRAAASEGGDIESRIADAFGSVRKGEARSLTTDAGSGGPITPPELSNYVWDRLVPRSVALASGIRVIGTDRHTISWPTITGDPDAAWVAETDVIPESDPVFGTLSAEPKKLASRVEFSNEVLDDSEPSAGDTVRRLMLRALAGKLDLSIFEGNPAADLESIKGLKYQAGIQTDTALGADGGPIPAGADGIDLVTEALGLLEDADVPGPFVAVMRPSVWRQFRELRDGQNRRLLPPGATAIEGATVYTTTRLSATETRGTSADTSSIYIYSTDPDVAPLLVRRQDVTVDLDRSRLFDKDMSEIRAKTRVDFIVPQPVAVVRIVGVRPA